MEENKKEIRIKLIKNTIWWSYYYGWDLAEWLERLANNPGLDPGILRHSGIWGAADKAEFNNVQKKKKSKTIPLYMKDM
jgi:hypothetical protein